MKGGSEKNILLLYGKILYKSIAKLLKFKAYEITYV